MTISKDPLLQISLFHILVLTHYIIVTKVVSEKQNQKQSSTSAEDRYSIPHTGCISHCSGAFSQTPLQVSS